MTDISLLWGGDLTIGPTGDIALVSGDQEAQQRIIRRLMTAAGNGIEFGSHAHGGVQTGSGDTGPPL